MSKRLDYPSFAHSSCSQLIADTACAKFGDVRELTRLIDGARLDRLNLTIAELSQAIEQEVEKYPAAQRLMTHPGVGALTALAPWATQSCCDT